jgi:hypothetical protein
MELKTMSKRAKKQANQKSPINMNKKFKANGMIFRYRANTNTKAQANQVARFFRNGKGEMARVRKESNGSYSVYIGDRKKKSRRKYMR